MSLERSNFSTSSGFCCIKIYTKISEKLQVKYQGIISTGASVIYTTAFFHILSLNMHSLKLYIIQNGG